MRKAIFALMLLVAMSAQAQTNLQFHYDFGKNRNYVTTTLEMFKPDKWGNTFFFVDFDYNMGEKNHPSSAYMEIARCLKFWNVAPRRGPAQVAALFGAAVFRELARQLGKVGLAGLNAVAVVGQALGGSGFGQLRAGHQQDMACVALRGNGCNAALRFGQHFQDVKAGARAQRPSDTANGQCLGGVDEQLWIAVGAAHSQAAALGAFGGGGIRACQHGKVFAGAGFVGHALGARLQCGDFAGAGAFWHRHQHLGQFDADRGGGCGGLLVVQVLVDV